MALDHPFNLAPKDAIELQKTLRAKVRLEPLKHEIRTIGGASGMFAMFALGFFAFGWVTGGTATQMANAAARTAEINALVPICVAQAMSDPDHQAKIEGLRAAGANAARQRDALTATGWAMMPGTETTNRSIAEACARQVLAAQA